MPPSLHLGRLHLSLSGLCAALGLVAALTLCQSTARLVRLEPARVWDAAVAMILAALVLSRLLLVLGSWPSFLAAPLLLLSLPSLNDTGLLLTAAFMLAYLRWKRLPLLAFLDAIAPCCALLWAALSVGAILAGTRDGLPTSSPLGLAVSPVLKVQPVEFYTAVVATLFCGLLIRRLPRRRPGLAAGLGLILAGAAAFLLDFLRVPAALFAAAILDPVQWLGLAMIAVGGGLFAALAPDAVREPEKVADAV